MCALAAAQAEQLISLHLTTSPYISLHLPIPPYISPTPPYTSLHLAQAEQLIIVGDTRQLPPTVASASAELRDALGASPMERLERAAIGQRTLRVQYRMPPELLEHPSRSQVSQSVSGSYARSPVEAHTMTLHAPARRQPPPPPPPFPPLPTHPGPATTQVECTHAHPPTAPPPPPRYFYDSLVTCAAGGPAPRPPKGFAWPGGKPLCFVDCGRDLEVSHGLTGGRSAA